MSEDESAPLEPAPGDIAALIGAIALSPWPTTENDLISAYSELGITVGPLLDPDDSGLTTHTLLSPEGVPGFAQFFSGEFIGLSFFAYDSPEAGFADTFRGFDELRAQLERRFGQPGEASAEDAGPTLLWTLGAVTISVARFTDRDSVVQFGVEHDARSAAYSAQS